MVRSLFAVKNFFQISFQPTGAQSFRPPPNPIFKHRKTDHLSARSNRIIARHNRVKVYFSVIRTAAGRFSKVITLVGRNGENGRRRGPTCQGISSTD